MATVYEQIWSRLESGKGEISFRFLISDDYDALFTGTDYDARTAVDFVRVGTFKSDLDTADGLQGVDELQITIDQTACKTSVDQTAFDFILECLDDTASRYCLLYADGSLAFRGILNSKGDADDILWHGSQYGTAPAPLREWKLTAKNYAIVKLDKTIKDVMDTWKASTESTNYWEQWTDEWIDANVKNRNAYHPSSKSGFGADSWSTFIRLGQLVNLNKLLRKMLDIIEGMDTTLSTIIEETEIPLLFSTPEIVPGVNSANSEVWNNWNIKEFNSRITQSKFLSFGESVSDDNSPFVSFRLVDPSKAETSESFYKAQKFINLIFELARSFGMYADLTVDDEGVTHITFMPRDLVSKNPDGSTKQLYIRDVESASLTTEPTVFEGGANTYVGIACENAIDGDPGYNSIYGADVYYVSNKNKESQNTDSKLRGKVKDMTPLMLSTGLTIAKIDPELLPDVQIGVGNDFFPDKTTSGTAIRYYPLTISRVTRRFNFSGNMLHNSFVTFPAESEGRFGTLHKLIYGKTTERFYKWTGSAYIRSTDTADDYTAWRPFWQLTAEIDGTTKSFRTLSEFVNHIAERDGKYFQTEYSLTVPFLSGFRLTADGADSYHNLKLGSVTVLDSRNYVVVGIERDFDKVETKLRLHNLERFAFSTPAEPSEDPEYALIYDTSTSEVSGSIKAGAGEAIQAGNIVSLFADGLLYVSRPTSSHYRRVIGIALNDAAEGEFVNVCRTGDCTPSSLSFVYGTPLFLREPDVDGVNITTSQLTVPSDDEYIWQRVGYGNQSNGVFINIEEPFWYFGYPT